jgi:hypothetical protein
MNTTIKDTNSKTEFFDLFGNKCGFKERKDMPQNEYLFQKVIKEIKPIQIQDS